MNRPLAKKVRPLSNYILEIEFDNGEVKLFDVKPYMNGDWYEELKNPDVFNSVRIAGISIEWVNGQDICPDALYYDSMLKIGA